jgi:hypothetical protein
VSSGGLTAKTRQGRRWRDGEKSLLHILLKRGLDLEEEYETLHGAENVGTSAAALEEVMLYLLRNTKAMISNLPWTGSRSKNALDHFNICYDYFRDGCACTVDETR